MEHVSIFVINYNGENVLLETIQSLIEQDYPAKSITLIDDGSNDKSISIIQQHFPDIEIIGMSYNTGFPNKLRKIALETPKSRFVFLTDNDIVYEKTCLSRLIQTIQSHPNIGICTPRLMYYSNKTKNYVCWTLFHYLCTSISPLRDTHLPPDSSPIDTLGGGVMLVDKEKIKQIGNINDSYPMGWGEDAEIYARMKIAGYRTLYVPFAAGFHHAKEFVTKRKSRPFAQSLNRWNMILTMYQLKTIILVLPALILYEITTIIMLIPKKMAIPYINGFLKCVFNVKDIYIKRKSIQKTRQVKDKNFLTTGPMYVPKAYLANPLYKLGINCLNAVFSIYWHLISFLL
jgi:GT2 family glycosyltransferase